MANVVGDRFQITIDKRIREQLGIQPGDIAIERVEGGRLFVDFVPRPHNESLLGVFKRTDGLVQPITDWEALKDAAWASRTAEIMEALEEDSVRHGTKPRRKAG